MVSFRLGLQVPEYRYSDDPAQIFPELAAQAAQAEQAGFDAFFVMDHLIGVPGLSEVGEPILESYVTLGALAGATQTIKLGALVTGSSYRQPALLAKMVTTLDVISGGRAILGLGAGWYEREHLSYGYPFPGTRERLARMHEALAIITAMLRDGQATFDGEFYRAADAFNSPRIRPDLPVMVGGTGEKLTFGAAARYASDLNVESRISDLPRKMAAVDARCAEIGRDRRSLRVSYHVHLTMAETSEQARRQFRERLRRQGVDYDGLSAGERDELYERNVVGSPEEASQRLAKEVLAHGMDGLIVAISDADWHPASIDLAADSLRPLVDRLPH